MGHGNLALARFGDSLSRGLRVPRQPEPGMNHRLRERMKASVPTSQAPEAELHGFSLSPLVPGDYHRVMRAMAWHGWPSQSVDKDTSQRELDVLE